MSYPGQTAQVKKKPSAWWFALPLVLVILSAVSFVGILLVTLIGSMSAKAEVNIDGAAHVVQVEPNTKHTVLVPNVGPVPECSFVDSQTDQAISINPGGSFSKTVNNESWVSAGSIESGSGNIEITCTSTGAAGPTTTVQLIEGTGRGFVGGIVASLLVPAVLVVLAIIALIVILVRRSRATSTDNTWATPPGQAPYGGNFPPQP